MPRLYSLLIVGSGPDPKSIDIREEDGITRQQADEIVALAAREDPKLTGARVYLYPGPRIPAAITRDPTVRFGEEAKPKAEPKPRGERPPCATAGCKRKGAKTYGGHCLPHAPQPPKGTPL